MIKKIAWLAYSVYLLPFGECPFCGSKDFHVVKTKHSIFIHCSCGLRSPSAPRSPDQRPNMSKFVWLWKYWNGDLEKVDRVWRHKENE